MSDILFENQIALVLSAKNESKYIGEWLDYHYRIGVDKFYVYNNNSEDQDELEKVLEPWIEAGIVDYVIFPGIMAQLRIYNDALKRHMFDCKYMGIIDTDEFIFVKTGQTLLEYLDEFFSHAVNIGGLAIHWRMFGSNGHEKYTPELVTERFTRRAPNDHFNNQFIKNIFNPRWVLSVNSTHYEAYRLGCCGVDENFVEVKMQNTRNENSAEKIQLNHYFVKSKEEFIWKKSRGKADNLGHYEDTQFFTDDRNEVEDTELRDFYRELRKFPLRQTFHDDSYRLMNLVTMLEDQTFEGMLEKYLTCFYLSRKIENISDDERKILTNLSLDGILKSLSCANIKPPDVMVLFDMLPKIFSTRLRKALELIGVCKPLIDAMLYNTIVNSNDATTHERVYQTKIMLEDLGRFLNEDFFNE